MRGIAILAISLGMIGSAAAQTPSPPPQPSSPPPLSLPRVINPLVFGSRGTITSSYTAFANSRFYADVYQNILDYGRCAVNVAPARSKSFVEAAPNTLDERVKAQRLSAASSACLPYGYRAPVMFLRAGIAEALYKRQSISTGINRADLTQLIAGEQIRDRSRLVNDRRFMHAALCVATRAPEAVDALLRSKPGSSEERAALDIANARSNGCMSGSVYRHENGGSSLLRAYLAESAYRAVTS